MNFYLYVIGSEKKPKKTYVGWTNNVDERLKKHNKGKGAKFTRGRVWKILYTEKFSTKTAAMKREYEIKKNFKFRNELRSKI